jgi:hypothetical protein
MAKRETYCKFFDTEESAFIRCQNRNRAARAANNFKDIYCLVDGPSDNFAVVDLSTAIDLGNGYQIVD